jgi:hypothetical protein
MCVEYFIIFLAWVQTTSNHYIVIFSNKKWECYDIFSNPNFHHLHIVVNILKHIPMYQKHLNFNKKIYN